MGADFVTALHCSCVLKPDMLCGEQTIACVFFGWIFG